MTADQNTSHPSRMAASSEGWVLVPVEPTSEMFGAGGVQAFKDDMAGTPVREAVGNQYRAMLAARPDTGREVEPVAVAKKTMTLTLTDEEMAALEEIAKARDLSYPKVFRSGLKVEQLLTRGLAELVRTDKAPMSASTPQVAVPVSEEMVQAVAMEVMRRRLSVVRLEGTALSWDTSVLVEAIREGLAVPDKGVQGDQGSSGGLGQPCSGSQPGADVGATAALAKEHPPAPWSPGSGDNCKIKGWHDYFDGRDREACPFPLSRQDLQRGYRIGWDMAKGRAE